MCIQLLIVLLLCSQVKAESNAYNDTYSNINFDGLRLAQTIWPRHYDFTIKTYVPGYDAVIEKDKEFTFEATMFVQSETDTIILNAGQFDYLQENCHVRTKQNKVVRIKSIVPHSDRWNRKVAFVLVSEIPIGLTELVIDYNGKISHESLGIYKTAYSTDDAVKYGVGTQFESMYARWMVPCFDEPLFKARWTVTIIHPKGTRALSNQIEIGEPEEMGDFLITKFKKTVLMSTYILAIFVAKFDYVEGYTRTGVRLRVWIPAPLIGKVRYSLQAGLRCLEGMEKLYGEPYPMEKLDIIGIKPMNNGGGMENYGLITIQENFLLYKDGDLYSSKIEGASLIAHEIAHMWFGNLVTMKWWNHLWLNEGFASYAESVGQKLISNGIWDGEDSSIASLQLVFDYHATDIKLPLVPNSNMTFDEIENGIFRVVYDKGRSILSMFKYLIGEDFDVAIRRYLQRNKFKNVDSNHLLYQLRHVLPQNLTGPRGETPLDIYKFADRWLKQPGYPILYVEEINQTSVRVTQNSTFGHKWDIPVFVQEKKHKLLAWLPFDKNLTITQYSSNALVLNYDSYVIARVNYTKTGWNKIFTQLREDHTIYSDRTKYRLITDAFELSGIAAQEVTDALTPYLKKEKAYIPWMAAVRFMKYNSYQIKLSPELIDVLPKEDVPKVFSDDASYVASRVKDQQRELYCTYGGDCHHQRSDPVTIRSLFKRK